MRLTVAFLALLASASVLGGCEYEYVVPDVTVGGVAPPPPPAPAPAPAPAPQPVANVPVVFVVPPPAPVLVSSVAIYVR